MFTLILGAVIGSVITLVIANNLSAKQKAAIQAKLDEANAKLNSLVKKN